MRRLVFVMGAVALVFLASLAMAVGFAPIVAFAQTVFTDLRTTGDITVGDDLVVTDDTEIGGNLTVTGVLAAASYITGSGNVELPANVSVVGNLVVAGTTSLVGNVSDSGGVWTLADNALIDGQADAVQLTVQGHSTQNAATFVVENSAGADQFTVSNAGDATVTDDLIVTDDASANDLTVADFVNITAQSAIVMTDNATLTPVGSLQPLTAAGAVGTDGGTKIAHTTDYLILINIGAQTITFTETTGLKSAGNIALGAGDAATLVWADGGWVQIAGSNN